MCAIPFRTPMVKEGERRFLYPNSRICGTMSAKSLPALFFSFLFVSGLNTLGDDADSPIKAELKAGHLLLSCSNLPLGEFWFDHPKILRPFFANLRAPDGTRVTRTFPPIEGIDAMDHADMHPGLWLGFGDLGGEDFWRNKGKIRHNRFITDSRFKEGRLAFATESSLFGIEGIEIATMENHFEVVPGRKTLRILWDARMTAITSGVYFGDQEEMGLGVRVATPITEQNGGLITNGNGTTTAKATWGKAAAWCDYSGLIDGKRVGVLIIPDAANATPSWWHNRDYGVFVSNPFGRSAMKQGEVSRIEVKPGETYRIKHQIILHSEPVSAAVDFETLVRETQ